MTLGGREWLGILIWTSVAIRREAGKAGKRYWPDDTAFLNLEGVDRGPGETRICAYCKGLKN